uniref:Uncharacterized protein n=1 Tax=Megaselia scalaris TaxID=36166 RepID=T1GZ68_MEGSC
MDMQSGNRTKGPTYISENLETIHTDFDIDRNWELYAEVITSVSVKFGWRDVEYDRAIAEKGKYI